MRDMWNSLFLICRIDYSCYQVCAERHLRTFSFLPTPHYSAKSLMSTPSVSVVLMPSRMRMQPLSFFKTRSSYGCTKPINSSICDSNFPSTTLSGNIRASGYFSFRLRIATPSPLSYFTPKKTSRNASLGRFIKSAHFYGLCFYHLQALLYATLFLYPTL